jgi:hypothetical protein
MAQAIYVKLPPLSRTQLGGDMDVTLILLLQTHIELRQCI